jgi:putative CocE/NonD family hydrolase
VKNGAELGPLHGVPFTIKDSIDTAGVPTQRGSDYLFKGVQNRFASGKSVKPFVLGTNVWRQEDGWSLARARDTKYFLRSAGGANSVCGNGTLSTTAPGKETADQYTYDPGKPVPTVGGPLCCGDHWASGPRDQRSVEAREDVLVYSTLPLAQDLEVTDPVASNSMQSPRRRIPILRRSWPDGFAQKFDGGNFARAVSGVAGGTYVD